MALDDLQNYPPELPNLFPEFLTNQRLFRPYFTKLMGIFRRKVENMARYYHYYNITPDQFCSSLYELPNLPDRKSRRLCHKQFDMFRNVARSPAEVKSPAIFDLCPRGGGVVARYQETRFLLSLEGDAFKSRPRTERQPFAPYISRRYPRAKFWPYVANSRGVAPNRSCLLAFASALSTLGDL